MSMNANDARAELERAGWRTNETAAPGGRWTVTASRPGTPLAVSVEGADRAAAWADLLRRLRDAAED